MPDGDLTLNKVISLYRGTKRLRMKRKRRRVPIVRGGAASPLESTTVRSTVAIIIRRMADKLS